MSLSPETREHIQGLDASTPVFLFMKGTPEAPQCGFSAQVVQILARVVPHYETFDVLSDGQVREGIKEYADWPTIPQLYFDGELVGGCDIIKEMYESGELQQALGLQPASGEPPALEITPAARALLSGASERAGGADLHLSIDARFQSGLGLGPLQSGELRVEVDGLSLHMDRETAQRADGIRIDAVDTGQGPQLSIDNPNAPVVGEMGPGELKALLDAGEPVALFDVRPADEAAKARIPGARLLDAEGEAQLASLPRDARIVFHCHHGGRSQAAAERYASLGFRNVYNLVGGVDAWSVSVDPSLPRY